MTHPLLQILAQHVGEANKISRHELWVKYGLQECECNEWPRKHFREEPVTDRQMRRELEALRQTAAGARICSTTLNGGGYFLAADDDEWRRAMASDWSRVRTTADRLRTQIELGGGTVAQIEATAEQMELF